ncbi:MAG TPA: molybdopterin-dependent oxidoreductase [Syntrophorhabdaceae bacterium]|nr:molybdopterin-dependent oxidoreductase [Syntrophorhabdaceae bacterium]
MVVHRIILISAFCLCLCLAALADDAARQNPQASCVVPPLVMPPTPAKIPEYAELDTTTGLHVTGTMQQIDLTTYRLEVTGTVDSPLKLAYDELRCMPRIEARLKLVCPEFFEDTATWAGASLKSVLQMAKVKTGATGIRLFGADGYSVMVPINAAMSDGTFLAYEWEGKALPALHGFPLRAVFPGSEGLEWVKWLIKIEVY